jgi:hypothetical protein
MSGDPIRLLLGHVHLRKAMKTREQRQQQLSSDFKRVAELLRQDGR